MQASGRRLFSLSPEERNAMETAANHCAILSYNVCNCMCLNLIEALAGLGELPCVDFDTLFFAS